MASDSDTRQFQQLHIDVARNATDDFNPFHDSRRWQNVVGNPFAGPIVLGFQLECLIADHMRRYRQQHGEEGLIEERGLHYSHFEFKYANAVLPGQALSLTVKDSQWQDGEVPALSNRLSLKADGRLAVAGFKRETRAPLGLPDLEPAALGDLRQAADRATVGSSGFFLKRKYMMTSNAKNFLAGSAVDQADYIDEIGGRVAFPELYPCALLSCALLEQAQQQGHDFEREPMVYKSHKLSVDRRRLRALRSNDVLHLLTRHADPDSGAANYECFGVLGDGGVLFRGRIELLALAGRA